MLYTLFFFLISSVEVLAVLLSDIQMNQVSLKTRLNFIHSLQVLRECVADLLAAVRSET